MLGAKKIKTTVDLPALSLQELLALLAQSADLYNKGQQNTPCLVTLFCGEQIFHGYVAKFKSDDEGKYIVFVEHDEAVSVQSVSLLYLPITSITGIRVQEAEHFLPLLSGGKLEAKIMAPSILELRKKIDLENSKIRTYTQSDIRIEVRWDSMAQEERYLLGLLDLIETTMNSIHKLMSDDNLKVAFIEQIINICFENAEEAELSFEQDKIIVRANLLAGEDGRLREDEFIVNAARYLLENW